MAIDKALLEILRCPESRAPLVLEEDYLVSTDPKSRRRYRVEDDIPNMIIEESEIMDLTAAEERFKRLRAVLGEGSVGLVHGQMRAAEKDAAMAAFQAGETSVLVATTVIEVGVNVPNATIMVIERAEIFGLAQLHQLRGRVGRGSAESTCLLMYQAPLKEGGRRRLEVLRETEDGFVISETDLQMRGAGDMIGTAQSGLRAYFR